ncbi:MAG: YciI family protein [Pirellulales bacterium]
MPQWVVIAWDGTDADAPARRMAARPSHLSGIAPLFADGRMREGGAILSDDGRMIGSVCVVEFPDQAAMEEWLQSDPYVTQNVWKKFEVYPFRSAKPADSGAAINSVTSTSK